MVVSFVRWAAVFMSLFSSHSMVVSSVSSLVLLLSSMTAAHICINSARILAAYVHLGPAHICMSDMSDMRQSVKFTDSDIWGTQAGRTRASSSASNAPSVPMDPQASQVRTSLIATARNLTTPNTTTTGHNGHTRRMWIKWGKAGQVGANRTF